MVITLFYTSRSGMNAHQNKLDVISNNLANVGTIGYKKLNTKFEDLYSNTLVRRGNPTTDSATNLYAGSGVKNTSVYREFEQGNLLPTGSTTDVAIDGEGFFKMYKPDGSVVYTRNGSFKIDRNGDIVDNNGYKLSVVDDFDEEINFTGLNLPSSDISIDKEGAIYIKENENFVKVGNIKTYKCTSGDGLLSVGESMFIPKDGVVMTETANRDILQGKLESSNVDVGEEMTDMIVAQRSFQINSTALRTTDEMWGMINSLR